MPEVEDPTAPPPRWWPASAGRASAWYLVLTLGMTWPLAAGIARDIPWDLGDSLLNCWILGWNADHVLRALGGDIGALRGILDANIFYPSPLALAYSELLVAQTLQILPVYALTHNLILCYNLLFLSTFVLSGTGMFLLARHFTRDWRVAFVAGLIFAFAPYRWAQISHLQVISVQWMPFVLYGFARWAAHGGWRPLAGATAALVAQNLSCGYFLVYFSLFVPPYVLWCLARHGRLGDVRRWAALGGAAVITTACTVPFLLPYLRLREISGERRPISEVIGYSADTLSYVTTNEMLRLWGGIIDAYPRPEGDLFMGLTALGLAIGGCVAALRRTWRGPGDAARRASAVVGAGHIDGAATLVPTGAWGSTRGARAVRHVALVAGAVHAAAAALIVLGFGGRYRLGPIPIQFSDLARVSLIAAACAAIAIALLPADRRRRVLAAWRSPVAAFAAITVVAWWLSLGPEPHGHGRPIGGPAVYAWLYAHVPGVDGLRVPARLGFIVSLGIAMLAAAGLRRAVQRWPRVAGWLCGLAGAMVIAEGTVAPLSVNLSAPDRELAPPARVAPGNAPAPLDRYLAALPAGTILVEFPFGDASWEVQHVYRSTQHWKRLVNGYSGGFPLTYMLLRTYLRRAGACAAGGNGGAAELWRDARGVAPGGIFSTRRGADARVARRLGRT